MLDWQNVHVIGFCYSIMCWVFTMNNQICKIPNLILLKLVALIRECIAQTCDYYETMIKEIPIKQSHMTWNTKWFRKLLTETSNGRENGCCRSYISTSSRILQTYINEHTSVISWILQTYINEHTSGISRILQTDINEHTSVIPRILQTFIIKQTSVISRILLRLPSYLKVGSSLDGERPRPIYHNTFCLSILLLHKQTTSQTIITNETSGSRGHSPAPLNTTVCYQHTSWISLIKPPT